MYNEDFNSLLYPVSCDYEPPCYDDEDDGEIIPQIYTPEEDEEELPF